MSDEVDEFMQDEQMEMLRHGHERFVQWLGENVQAGLDEVMLAGELLRAGAEPDERAALQQARRIISDAKTAGDDA